MLEAAATLQKQSSALELFVFLKFLYLPPVIVFRVCLELRKDYGDICVCVCMHSVY